MISRCDGYIKPEALRKLTLGRGNSIKALQAQLGHTDARLKLSAYPQPMPEAQKKLAGKIARVLFPDVP